MKADSHLCGWETESDSDTKHQIHAREIYIMLTASTASASTFAKESDR